MNEHASTPVATASTRRRRLALAGVAALAVAVLAGGCAKEKTGWEKAAEEAKEAAEAVGEATSESAKKAADKVETESKKAWESTKEGVKEVTPGSEEED